MKTFERDTETRKADIRRAMYYRYRIRRRYGQKIESTIRRLLVISATLFVTAAVIAVLV